jgi:hypothetical protein
VVGSTVDLLAYDALSVYVKRRVRSMGDEEKNARGLN